MQIYSISITLLLLSVFKGLKCDLKINSKLSYEAQLENFLAITADFFTGLYDFNQYRSSDIELNSTTFLQIESTVDYYIYLIKKAHGLLAPEELPVNQHTTKVVKRRNAGINKSNEYTVIADDLTLRGFEEFAAVPAQHPIDIILFEKTLPDPTLYNIQYAASLEASDLKNQTLPTADLLALYKYVNAEFIKVFDTPISKGVRLQASTIDDKIYIAVASKCDFVCDPNNWSGSILFEVDTWKDALVPVQMLGKFHANDVIFWNDYGHTYLGLAARSQNLRGSKDSHSQIYRWLGGHFDIVDQLAATDARKISEFVIGSDRFIILANHIDEHGLTATYSPVYKYDLHKERFVIYQHLSTHAAVDIKYFTIKNNQVSTYEDDYEQHLIIIANQYESDMNGEKIFKTTSILYKFSDNYFVPFQGFELYSAIEWLPFKDPNGKPFLLVNCFYEGLRAFHFDGWKFVEAPLEFGGAALGRGINSIRAQHFLGQPVLVVSNPSDVSFSLPNIFRPMFRSTTSPSAEKNNLLAWCQSRLSQTAQFDIEEVVDQMEYAPKTTDAVVNVQGTVDFANKVHIEKLSTDAIWTDNYLIDDTVLRNINNLYGDLKHHMSYMDALLNKSNTLIRTDLPIEIRGSLSAPRIISAKTKLDQIETKFLNNQDFDEIRQKILQNQLSDVLEFDKLTIDTILEFRQINGRPVDSLIFKNQDYSFETLVIDNIMLQNNLKSAYVNNATFDDSVLILNNTAQHLKFLDVNNLKTNRVNSVLLNNVPVTEKPEMNHFTGDKLDISNLIVESLNGINTALLYENSLKKFGDQEISAEYELPMLSGYNFIGPELSNVRSNYLINIKKGTYDISYDIALKGVLNVKQDLFVLNRLNNIPVINNEMQILFKNSEKLQKIIGNKVFESVELLNPISLQGMIDSSALDKMNPVSIYSEDLILEGNFVLNNLVTIRKFLSASEIVANNKLSNFDTQAYTISNLLQNGLPLDSPEILPPFEFKQPFKCANLNVDYVNQKPTDSWVSLSTDPIAITAKKTFTSDLQVSGSCDILGFVNGINVTEIFDKTLRISIKNQQVDGRVVLENVNIENLFSPNISLGDKPLYSYLFRSADQYLNHGVVITGQRKCAIDQLQAKKVRILQQSENNDNDTKNNLLQIMNNLYEDCVTDVNKKQIIAPKTFKNISIGQLNVKNENGFNLPEPKKREIRAATEYQSKYEGPVHMTGRISIRKLTYIGTLDGVSNTDFGSQWLLSEVDQVITAPITISKVTSEEAIDLKGYLNGVDLRKIETSVIYTNRDYILPNVSFENGISSLGYVTVNQNQISQINPSSFVYNEVSEMQYITAPKKFSSLNVMGKPILTTGFLGDFDMQHFCRFIDDSVIDKKLKVLGSADFINDLDIFILNNNNLDKLLNEVWYSNADTVVSGNKNFGDGIFQNNISVNNLINNINLNWLGANYFSLSKNQTITGNMKFFEKVDFHSNIVATSPVEVVGSVNDILDLSEFVFNSLDKTTEQRVEGKFNFETMTVAGDLYGSINNIDFEHDVLRYNTYNNYVISKKIFDSISVDSLIINKGGKLSEINVEEWLQNSVACYNEMDFCNVESSVKLNGEKTVINEILANGPVNGIYIDPETILLRQSNQTITGSKEFLVHHEPNSATFIYQAPLHVNNLRVVLMEPFLNDLYFLNSDGNGYTSFVYPGKGLQFKEQLTIKEMSGKILKSEALIYGVDLPNIQNKIQEMLSVLNYQTVDMDFSYLNYVAGLLKDNIEAQARFLHHYEVIQQIEGDVVLGNANNGDFRETIGVYNDNKMQTMYWHKQFGRFEYQNEIILQENLNENYSLDSLNNTNRVVPVTIENKECFILLDSESVLKCKMDNALDYIILDKYFTPGATAVTIVQSKLGTLIAFLLQQQSKQGLPIGEVVVYLINKLNEKNPSKLIQSLRPTRPTSISLVATTYESDFSHHVENEPTYGENNENFAVSKHVLEDPTTNDIFLAITSDKVQRAMHHGSVEIYKLNQFKLSFEFLQSVPSTAPQQVQFAVLPVSNELVLYVLSRQQARPLSILLYKGVAGFKEIVTASIIPHGIRLSTLTTQNEHFVFIGDQNYTTVLKAVFVDLHS